MRKAIALTLILFLCLPAMVAPAEAPEDGDALFLPEGVWTLVADGTWTYILQTDVTLTSAQRKVAEDAGIPLTDGVIANSTSLSSKQLFSLYPGAETFFEVPSIRPELTLFELTGEWFYGDDDVLYYRHGDSYMDLTVDEVFAQLGGQPATSAEEKIIYLTIDDTPSQYTMDLLATLDRLNIKATFFVVGAYVKQEPVYFRAIVDQGHAIANHSYSHNAELLRSSFKNCLTDFQRTEEIVNETLGYALPMPILRIPYGAGTLTVDFRTQLQEAGYLWIDWNCLNGDTEPGVTNDEEALQRAFSTAGRYDGSLVMLVHDGKKRTIRTLETMVEHFHEQGYEFRVLDTNIEKIPGVRMGFPI